MLELETLLIMEETGLDSLSEFDDFAMHHHAHAMAQHAHDTSMQMHQHASDVARRTDQQAMDDARHAHQSMEDHRARQGSFMLGSKHNGDHDDFAATKAHIEKTRREIAQAHADMERSRTQHHSDNDSHHQEFDPNNCGSTFEERYAATKAHIERRHREMGR